MDTDEAVRLVTTVTFLLLSGCARDAGSSEELMMTEQSEDIAAVNRLSEDYAAAWATAEPAITGSTLPQAYIDQFPNGRRYGKTRAISVDVRKLADLKATRQIMEIRLQVK